MLRRRRHAPSPPRPSSSTPSQSESRPLLHKLPVHSDAQNLAFYQRWRKSVAQAPISLAHSPYWALLRTTDPEFLRYKEYKFPARPHQDDYPPRVPRQDSSVAGGGAGPFSEQPDTRASPLGQGDPATTPNPAEYSSEYLAALQEYNSTCDLVKKNRSRESSERAIGYRELESRLHPEFMDLLRDKGLVTMEMLSQGDQPIELLRIIHSYMHLPSA
jgi:hypothetical protein